MQDPLFENMKQIAESWKRKHDELKADAMKLAKALDRITTRMNMVNLCNIQLNGERALSKWNEKYKGDTK